MTPEEFKEKAQEIYDTYKNYSAGGHEKIAYLIRDCLESLGYKEGLDILFSVTYI